MIEFCCIKICSQEDEKEDENDDDFPFKFHFCLFPYSKACK